MTAIAPQIDAHVSYVRVYVSPEPDANITTPGIEMFDLAVAGRDLVALIARATAQRSGHALPQVAVTQLFTAHGANQADPHQLWTATDAATGRTVAHITVELLAR